MSHHTHSNSPSLLSCFKSYFALKFVMFHHFADEAELFMYTISDIFACCDSKLTQNSKQCHFKTGKEVKRNPVFIVNTG